MDTFCFFSGVSPLPCTVAPHLAPVRVWGKAQRTLQGSLHPGVVRASRGNIDMLDVSASAPVLGLRFFLPTCRSRPRPHDTEPPQAPPHPDPGRHPAVGKPPGHYIGGRLRVSVPVENCGDRAGQQVPAAGGFPGL